MHHAGYYYSLHIIAGDAFPPALPVHCVLHSYEKTTHVATVRRYGL